MGWNTRLIRIFMKRKLFILSFLFFSFNVYSSDSCILEAINEMLVNTLPNNTWILGRSSVLVEKNKDNDFMNGEIFKIMIYLLVGQKEKRIQELMNIF